MVSEFVVGVCDGLDECEISLPEILSQSCPVLHGGCSIQLNSIQVYLYSAFYDTIVAKRFTGN